jgi:hypothetical protein
MFFQEKSALRSSPKLFSRRFLCKVSIISAVVVIGSGAAFAETAPSDCSVRAFGAAGDGQKLDTTAINAAIQACHSRGGGTVVFDAGTYRTGTIRLLDNITLKLEPGSTILGSSDLRDYLRTEKASEERDTALLLAENVHNIAIIGEGTIDGNGRAFTDAAHAHFEPFFDPAQTRQGEALVARMREVREGPVRMLSRPGILFLALHVDGLLLRGFHIRDSPNWTIHIGCSDHIFVSALDIRNSLLVPNSDGLDISTSRNAAISDSYIEAGDDALVIGGPCTDGWCQEPTENITVSNVTLRSRSAAIRIGPSAKDVRNLAFQNVIITDSNRGIGIQARSSEIIENLLFSNISIQTRLIDGPWWGAGEPITISVAIWNYTEWKPPVTLGEVRHVRFSNVIANSESPIVLYSTEPDRVADVGFRDLSLTMKAGPLTALFGGNIDLQPTDPRSLGLTRHDLSAVFAHNVSGLSLTGIQVHWNGDFPAFYQHAIQADDFKGLVIDGFQGEASSPSFASIWLRNGKGATIRNVRATSRPLLDAQSVDGLDQESNQSQPR